MQKINWKKFRQLLPLIFLIGSVASNVGCSGLFKGKLFKERAADTPAPDDYGVDKSFFVSENGEPKTFLCAWSPENPKGWDADQTTIPFANETPHCNVQFQISESHLIARLINPSFLSQPERWTELLRIPISRHYYYEKDRDSYGRETNQWIENSSRSHWSARPKMKLDLDRMDIRGVGAEGFGVALRATVSGVRDIEWDFKNNFLGFTLQTVADGSGEGTYQSDIRFNFLKFDHDPSFKKLPYHEENARFVNILHVMGRQVDGIEQELYAARWDIRKDTTFYMHGVPKEYQQLVVQKVDQWNDALQEIGAIDKSRRPFKAVPQELKHSFDLRYPSITWISDQRLSMYGPLGVGMAHADVRNGKILWGGIVAFGGMIEKYVNVYTPVDTTISTLTGKKLAYSAAQMIGKNIEIADSIQSATQASRGNMLELMSAQPTVFNNTILQLKKSPVLSDQKRAQALESQLKDEAFKKQVLASLVQSYGVSLQSEIQKVQKFKDSRSIFQLLGFNDFTKLNALEESTAEKNIKALTNLEDRLKLMRNNGSRHGAIIIDSELNIANLASGWSAAAQQSKRTRTQMVESVISSLMIHEFGHVLGLGHQFKENIVPKKNTAPKAIIAELAKKATAQENFRNFTSVMGYQSGETQMASHADEYLPGPHDKLVLQYLYRGQYPAFDMSADQYKYFEIPASGKMPEFTNGLRIGFFEQCNDYEASLASDPFCNRFDRGSSAQDIVKNYFATLSNNLLTSLYSMVGARGNKEAAESRVWMRALDVMGRVRLFYDEMRRRLAQDDDLKPLWDELRTSKEDLLAFSKPCQPDAPSAVQSVTLNKIFARTDILDMCKANALALKEMSFFLNLPQSDYTKVDYKTRYIAGGYLAGDAQRNWGNIFGSWYKLSNIPLKYTALLTTTSAQPLTVMGSSLAPNYFYDSPENRFLYRTLYPNEMTRILSQTVQNNMKFAVTGKDDTTALGWSVVSASGLIPYQASSSNESTRLPREFNALLDQQTQFKFDVVAILIDPVKPDSTENTKVDHYKKFTASVYDFATSKSTPVKDIYLLPNGDVFAWANGMFLYPISKMKFYFETSAYVMAYKVDFDEGPRDALVQEGLKKSLLEKHDEIATKCVNGFSFTMKGSSLSGGTGLAQYFDAGNKNFDGFKILPGISVETGNDKLGAFYDSVSEQFSKYEKQVRSNIPADYPIKSMARVCEESIRGIGQISAAAGLVNGYFLGMTPEYLEK